jgi:hypothetical protein
VNVATWDPVDILRLRAAGYRSELGRIEAVLTSVTAVGGGELDSAVRDRFAQLFMAARNELADARSAGPVVPDRWRKLAEARKAVEALGREVLAYVAGRLLAERELDGGAAAAAERLIASLTSRTGIDRPALLGIGDAECIDHMASIVRFRPLGTMVWQLPMIAHELGHHVAARLEDAKVPGVRPVQTWLARQSQDESMATGISFQQAGSWLHELFADAFATYSLGAAYPLSVMAIRVEYDRVAEESSTHPSWSRRVATMTATLEAVSRLDIGQRAADTFHENSCWLASRWVALTGRKPGAEDKAAGMVSLLTKHALPRLRYDVTGPVDRLMEELDTPEVPPPPEATPAHVLNAAWAWRLRHPGADDTAVSARALARCAQAAL